MKTELEDLRERLGELEEAFVIHEPANTYAYAFNRQKGKSTMSRQRWEYRIEWLMEYTGPSSDRVATAEDQAKHLDALGLAGWEAFAVVERRVFLKRPI